MPNKNNLAAFKINSKKTLLNTESQLSNEVKSTSWRKPKLIAEKQSELIGLRFTISELAIIKAKAGLVPIATYLKNELITKTKVFN